MRAGVRVGRGGAGAAFRLRAVLVVALLGATSFITSGQARAAPVKALASAASVVPSGFSEVVAISGLTQPTAVAFAGDGRAFVAEKSGLIKVFDSLSDSTPTVFADLRTQVHNFWDRGMLGLALDPQFPTRPYVYALYTYDAVPGGTAPRWGTVGGTSDGCPNPPGSTVDGCVVQARLSRLTASGNQMTGSEQVLVSGWCQQFPSHSIGTVTFGPDGGLYVSAGDGANFNYADYGQTNNPCGDPPSPAGTSLTSPTAQGGALRSQSMRRPSGQPATLDGTIIRVDPNTGAGLAGNPFASSADPNARRIIAYGLRNPFRFDVRPGTEQLWVGDVGWNTWEEINRIADINDGTAENFGWPCYEGSGRQGGYDGVDLNSCETLYGIGQTEPFFRYRHDASMFTGDSCPTGSSSVSGIAFENGSNYPSDYDGALFIADASRGCVWVMKRGAGADPSPGQLSQFVGGAGQPVQVVTGPGGDIFYVDLEAGQVRRVVYNGANHPPTAVISANPTSGGAPLAVTFDGSGSNDLDAGDVLSYAWDLDGDGQFDDSTAVAPNHTYTVAGTVTARLRVADQHGASDTESVTISVGAANSPPVPVIDAPTSALRWKVGDAIGFSGHATDAQDGTLPSSRLSWSVVLNHCPSNCHTHTVQGFTGVASGTFPAPDHEYPSSLSLVLTATDSAGASASTSLRLDPQTVNLTFTTTPSGLQLSVGAQAVTAPTTRTVIVGSSNSVSAPSPQALDGVSYAFRSWSDGGARIHNVTAPATATTYTATFDRAPVGCPAAPSFDYTIPTPVGPPAATSLPDGRVAYSALGADGQDYLVATDIIGDPLAVGPLECLGGTAADSPAVAAGTSFLALFARSADNRLWQRTITSTGTGTWSTVPTGASANGPAAVVTAGDVVHLVVRGTNGVVYHATRRGTTWSGWQTLGGAIYGTPAVAPRPGGGIAIFVRGTDNGIYAKYGDTGKWTGWSRLSGSTLSSPTVAWGYQSGRLDLFVTGTGGGLYQRASINGTWGGWYRLDATLPASARIAAAARGGRFIVYASTGGVTSYKQYVGTWVGYYPATYTCATCLPARRSAGITG
ncbi:MAG TPA: PQQ-dependent sugar dehydrogenase [Jiangellaceae bacterium]|nr:PQQ-dependent sugar dehydrogenase [Jiangellaceae bacterium]